jgi:hypothetical protein
VVDQLRRIHLEHAARAEERAVGGEQRRALAEPSWLCARAPVNFRPTVASSIGAVCRSRRGRSSDRSAVR